MYLDILAREYCRDTPGNLSLSADICSFCHTWNIAFYERHVWYQSGLLLSLFYLPPLKKLGRSTVACSIFLQSVEYGQSLHIQFSEGSFSTDLAMEGSPFSLLFSGKLSPLLVFHVALSFLCIHGYSEGFEWRFSEMHQQLI